MSKARLIKRHEIPEQQLKEEIREETRPSVFQTTVSSVVRWARERKKATEAPNAREKFAALFTEPQTE